MVENQVSLFYLPFPIAQELDLVFFAYGSPAVSKKDELYVKRPQLQVRNTHPLHELGSYVLPVS